VEKWWNSTRKALESVGHRKDLKGGDAIAPPPHKKKLESKAAGPAKSVVTV